jgi:hypothetical protein
VNLKKIESILMKDTMFRSLNVNSKHLAISTCCQLSTVDICWMLPLFSHKPPKQHKGRLGVDMKPSETPKIPPWNGQVAIDAHDWQSPRLEDLDIGSSSTTHVDNSWWMAQANRFRQEEMNETCSKDSVIVCI